MTANGPGGATSATAAPTTAVDPAPLPPVSVGTQTAEQGVAGNVETTDGRAIATWQPGSVPDGLVVSVNGVDPAPAEPGTGVTLSVPGLPKSGFPWPVDVEYAQAQPAKTVLGYSTAGKVYEPVPALSTAQLPARSDGRLLRRRERPAPRADAGSRSGSRSSRRATGATRPTRRRRVRR